MALSFFRKDTKEAPAGQSAEVEAFLDAPLEWSGAHGGVTEVVS